jgi:hypothetical protein
MVLRRSAANPSLKICSSTPLCRRETEFKLYASNGQLCMTAQKRAFAIDETDELDETSAVSQCSNRSSGFHQFHRIFAFY